MLTDKPVLIVEDNIYVALDLSCEVERLHGRVVGPVACLAEALPLLDQVDLVAVVVGAQSPANDLIALAGALEARRLPFVVQADNRNSPNLAGLNPAVPVLIRPVQPRDVLAVLMNEIGKIEPHTNQFLQIS